LPSGRSSTNGCRNQVSTFSCTISFESANDAAARTGTSARGTGSQRRLVAATAPSSAP
jgi:hypothetical protein